MAFLPQALDHARTGRPQGPARLAMVPVLVTVLALVAVLLPLAGPADAARKPKPRAPKAHSAPRVVGQPPSNYVPAPTSYFSFPNRGERNKRIIRSRVLSTIKSVWGGPRTPIGTPKPGNGSIRIVTWTFNDWSIAKALVAARKRGVTVQVISTRTANKPHAPWKWLRKQLGSKLYRPGYPSTASTVSFARQCRGACRGPGGTAHAKYFLFDNVGAKHVRNVVFQTSANLTTMAFNGQWNQAQVQHSAAVYRDFLGVFWQARLARSVVWPYHVAAFGPVVNYFFPRLGATPVADPVMQNLNLVRCTGATTGAAGARTMIRVIQYATYGDRGVWIAKKLRSLWDAGCNVAMIYTVASRPVLAILRKKTGRGPVPMKQSVVTDSSGTIVKYNHSKWMVIAGRWGSRTAAFLTLTGSANWSDMALSGDEQTQRIDSRAQAVRYIDVFKLTYRQKSSRRPSAGRVSSFGRGAAQQGDEPVFGRGIYRHLPED
jgi:phosphatidylserine/phosphatidylglycerophosphate/cardiolipin synthase-like enzyme